MSLEKKHYKLRFYIVIFSIAGLNLYGAFYGQYMHRTFNLSYIMDTDIFAFFDIIGIAYIFYYIYKGYV